jgi:molybdopterin-guanine dinucleotide biosynthesis protein A
MGTDKSLLDYHGKPQREYLFDLAQKYCSEVYFSCREEQQFSEKTIIDKHSELGPMSGILSALEYDKNIAWLVVACDMPLINEKSFDILIKNRNPDTVATTFFNKENNAPDPLFTIYEPKAADLLVAYVKSGNKSPKIFLQNADIQLIQLENIDFLKNINTKEEFDKLKSQ